MKNINIDGTIKIDSSDTPDYLVGMERLRKSLLTVSKSLKSFFEYRPIANAMERILSSLRDILREISYFIGER